MADQLFFIIMIRKFEESHDVIDKQWEYGRRA